MQSKLSFSLHFEMLTKRDKEELANEVKRAKGFTVDSSQFSDTKANIKFNVILNFMILILKGINLDFQFTNHSWCFYSKN
jgi:hypothetical protein